MSNQQKIRVAVLYGGRSGEHEVSLRSAASVMTYLDSSRFEVILVGIDKEGRWHFHDRQLIKDCNALPIYSHLPEVVLPPNPQQSGSALLQLGSSTEKRSVDVVFPVMHGPLCEDGTIQGLLELADVPYVGSGVLGSAVCMDKEVAKRLAREAGIPVVPWISVRASQWAVDRASLAAHVEKELGWPCFVKPANQGSSVGVHKVKRREDFTAAIDDALRYDTKVLVEKAISAREIEVSVLDDREFGKPPRVSIAGEIIPTHEFYSYESKYIDENGAALKIPAALSDAQMKTVQDLARRAFIALECEGFGRVDFFLSKDTGEWYLNEINTIPGFTSISMYPKMWEASGLKYADLLTELVELAIARHRRKAALVRDFHQK